MRNAARRWSLRSAIVFALIILTTVVTASTTFAGPSGQPDGATREGEQMHDLYVLVLWIALAVFFAVEGAIVLFIVKYRRRANDEALPPQIHGNNILEVIWTTIPVVIVLILFVFSFQVLRDIDGEADSQDLTVHVQGFQFQWQFTYCKNDLGGGSDAPAKAKADAYQGPCATKNDEVSVIGVGTAEGEPTMVIPIGAPVEFRLASDDVIHSFYVRDFLYKLDVVPGRDNAFKVTPTKLGEFEGQCAELCGTNHALMKFKVQVVSRADFDKYIATAGGAPAAATTR